MVTSYEFAKLSDGRPVTAYKITNREGEYAVILNYGATIQSVVVKDRNGNPGDVVLGPEQGTDPSSFRMGGSVKGRCGNRIAYATFSIDGKEYHLKTFRGPHHLHGAEGGLDKILFDAEIGDDSVTLHTLDKGIDGWEAEADVRITYTFTDNHALTIEYALTALGNTVLSPTNHAYWNLDCPNEILDTELKLFTETYAPKSELGMPDGRIAPVAGMPLDFSKGRTFRDGFASDNMNFFNPERVGYDDFYFLPGDGYRQVAEATNYVSGRRMRVFSDAQSLILFTPAGLPPFPGKNGTTMTGYTSFCLETQYVPNAVNCPEYKSPVFRTGETMHSTTVYAFDTVE